MLVQEETIQSDRFWIGFRQVSQDGTVYCVDRIHADYIVICFRLPDGRDGDEVKVELPAPSPHRL